MVSVQKFNDFENFSIISKGFYSLIVITARITETRVSTSKKCFLLIHPVYQMKKKKWKMFNTIIKCLLRL